MLEIDYNLEIAEGKGHISTYSPLIKSINGNAAILRAPNSSGKTYLLNLIAMALYGDQLSDKDGRISPILRNSIIDIKKRQNEKVTFDLKLSSQDGKTRLHACKSDADGDQISLYESISGERERPLPFSTFKENYYLVYDFPKNPLERIPDMVKSIKEEQERYQRKIGEFLKLIIDTQKEIAESRDDEKIEEIKKNLADEKSKYRSEKEELEQLDAQKDICERYLALRSFDDNSKKAHHFDAEIQAQKSNERKGRNRVARSGTKFETQKKTLTDSLRSKSNLVQELVSEIKLTELQDDPNVSNYMTYFDKFDYFSCIEHPENYNHDEQKKIFNYLKKSIESWEIPQDMKEASGKSQFYEKMLDALETAKENRLNVSIPGTDKSLTQLIRILKNEHDNSRKLGESYARLCGIFQKIDELNLGLDDIRANIERFRLLKDTLKESEEFYENSSGDEERLIDLQKEIEEHKTLITESRLLLQKYGYDTDYLLSGPDIITDKLRTMRTEYPECKNYFLSDGAELKKGIELMSTRISSISSSLPKLESAIARYTDKLSSLENKMVHKYYENRENIDAIKIIVDSISRKLRKYEGYISQIENEQSLDEQGTKYNEKLSEYLGNSIPSFPYQNEYVKPIKIDLLTKTIITDTDRRINMKNISTGQSMSLYVQTILNRPEDDKRKLIVLFDEAGTMDTNSLGPLKQTMAKLVNEGQLLFALFVSASDSEPKIDVIS